MIYWSFQLTTGNKNYLWLIARITFIKKLLSATALSVVSGNTLIHLLAVNAWHLRSVNVKCPPNFRIRISIPFGNFYHIHFLLFSREKASRSSHWRFLNQVWPIQIFLFLTKRPSNAEKPNLLYYVAHRRMGEETHSFRSQVYLCNYPLHDTHTQGVTTYLQMSAMRMLRLQWF